MIASSCKEIFISHLRYFCLPGIRISNDPTFAKSRGILVSPDTGRRVWNRLGRVRWRFRIPQYHAQFRLR